MPYWKPTRHAGVKVGLPWAMYFVTVPQQHKQGCYVREQDGSYAWAPSVWKAREHYDTKDIFVIGNEGYYLTMAEARQALTDGMQGIHYVDDFNDEWQDIYVSSTNLPFTEATVPEPIR
jgi:hypothetical protein